MTDALVYQASRDHSKQARPEAREIHLESHVHPLLVNLGQSADAERIPPFAWMLAESGDTEMDVRPRFFVEEAGSASDKVEDRSERIIDFVAPRTNGTQDNSLWLAQVCPSEPTVKVVGPGGHSLLGGGLLVG